MLEMDLIGSADGLRPYIALATTSVGVPDLRNSRFVPPIPRYCHGGIFRAVCFQSMVQSVC